MQLNLTLMYMYTRKCLVEDNSSKEVADVCRKAI